MLYYSNYLDNISKTPNNENRELVDAFIDSQWRDSTLLTVVEEETVVGSGIYNQIEVWKNTVSSFDTRVIKNEKDYRRLLFDSVTHQSNRGRMYKFNDSYWLVYDPTNEEEVYSEVLVRRCNNTAKWIDADTGEIVEMPCILDYDISATNPKVNKDVIVANSSITMIIQGNDKTHKLSPNQRFIFNSMPYKFIAYNNYMQDNYTTQDVPLLFMDLDFDTQKPSDDVYNGIADRTLYDFKVIINENPVEQVQQYSGSLTATVLLNESTLDKQVKWSSNDYATIDENGNYVLTGNVGSVAELTAWFGSFYDTIEITILNAVDDFYEIVISPMIAEIFEQETCVFEVNVCLNGALQPDIISVSASGPNSECYSLSQTDNKFTLTNLKQSSIPLSLVFTSGELNKTILVKLSALF